MNYYIRNMYYLSYIDKDGKNRRKKIHIINNRKMIKIGKDKFIYIKQFLKTHGGGVSMSTSRRRVAPSPYLTPVETRQQSSNRVAPEPISVQKPYDILYSQLDIVFTKYRDISDSETERLIIFMHDFLSENFRTLYEQLYAISQNITNDNSKQIFDKLKKKYDKLFQDFDKKIIRYNNDTIKPANLYILYLSMKDINDVITIMKIGDLYSIVYKLTIKIEKYSKTHEKFEKHYIGKMYAVYYASLIILNDLNKLITILISIYRTQGSDRALHIDEIDLLQKYINFNKHNTPQEL